MKIDNIKLERFANTERWKLLEKASSARQTLFKLGHINPEVFMDKEKAIGGNIVEEKRIGNVIETTKTVGLFKRQGMRSEIYEALIAGVQLGVIRSKTVKDIEELREMASAVHPEELDYSTDISVAEYDNKEMASEALKNLAEQYTKGILDTSLPGMSGTTIEEILKNPLVRAEAEKQGTDPETIEKTLKDLREASKQMVEQVKESGTKYEVGKFGKYPAVYVIPPVSLDRKKEVKREKPTGAGGYNSRVKLPPDAFKREEYPINGKMLQGIQVEKYVLTGGLLSLLNNTPSGSAFCQSLTKFKTVTETTHLDGITYIEHWITPTNSNLKTEGYMNRDEVEDMVKKFISLLES
ncbi:hypothetical protein GX888_00070 [Candidatus Dojkabacteria bacterium]|uniref:Uncharacterized protein n=1 Tax=Candidatus Dojkabacteria bacterium TaxID=2099670 RepID=A0A847VCS6_9BACT|nr:hypothetical protein [Candidatus Dojkabacteria bacterium]